MLENCLMSDQIIKEHQVIILRCFILHSGSKTTNFLSQNYTQNTIFLPIEVNSFAPSTIGTVEKMFYYIKQLNKAVELTTEKKA